MAEVYEKLLACAFDRLPERVRDAHLAPPVLKASVEPAADDGFRLTRPEDLDRPARQALMPKLGIKSWRDAGGLGVIYEGVGMAAVLGVLLRNPTSAQTLMARAWTRTGTRLQMFLSPYVDFSDVSEARYLALGGTCRRISACLRGRSGAHFEDDADRLALAAADMADALGSGAWILDLALLPSRAIGLVEVNPGLTPQDLAALRA